MVVIMGERFFYVGFKGFGVEIVCLGGESFGDGEIVDSRLMAFLFRG